MRSRTTARFRPVICAVAGDFDMTVVPCDGSSICSFALALRYDVGGYQYCQTEFFTHVFPEEITHNFVRCGLDYSIDPQHDCHGDGVLQSGDRARVRFSLQNIGGYAAYGVEAALGLSDVPGVHVESDHIDYELFDDIAPAECAWPHSAYGVLGC